MQRQKVIEEDKSIHAEETESIGRRYKQPETESDGKKTARDRK